MARSTEFQKIKRERMNQVCGCELCGRKYMLELHHIIPVSLGGEDTEENLILLCPACHSRLTPRSALTKLGLRKFDIHDYIFNYLHRKIYQTINDNGDRSALDVIDSVDQVMFSESHNFLKFTDKNSFIQFFSDLKKDRKEEMKSWQTK